jgi:CubicO group peptidase (beta-lactamase class C family)
MPIRHPWLRESPLQMLRVALAMCALILGSPGLADEPTDARAERVSEGLRPPVSFVGDRAWTLSERMEFYGVPGVALTVIDGSGVAWTRVYGLADRETGARVETDTLFQAGSVSKPVAAFAAMRMVEKGLLSLNRPVNEQLKSWQIPDNDFTRQVPVTLSHLLSHTGGLTVHGFGGYAVDVPLPSMLQILDGQAPANSPPIRVDLLPGSAWRYSGGGYTIAQLLMTEVSGQSFPRLMQRLVLKPIGMRRSSYSNPLPASRLQHAAAGVLPDRSAVDGKRHVYPEMAAAGLWTTSEDLALFAIEMQQALAGKSDLLRKSSARAMLEAQADVPYGRGFGLQDLNGEHYFGHEGWDEGFCTLLQARAAGGQGAVIMINANQPAFMRELLQAVAFEYDWPGYRQYTPVALSEFAQATAPGRYRYNGEQVVSVVLEDQTLYLQYAGDERTELIPVDDNRYLRRDREAAISFAVNDQGEDELRFELPDGKLQRHPRLADKQQAPRELLLAGDSKLALAAYRALKDSKDEAASEGYLNDEGMGLLQRNRVEAAIKLLTLNTELYPESANSWDSLGQAFWRKGDQAGARRCYGKALAIDPQLASAKEALGKLGE